MRVIERSLPLISVVICTYNRSDLLFKVLKTLICQTVSPYLFEIIIVDNNSRDETQNICTSIIADTSNLAIKYVLEINQGLSHARNRGWRESKGEYVAYIDDDCKVPPDWLLVAIRVIESVRPAVFGGPYYAYYISAKPFWFRDEYGSHTQGNEFRSLDEGEYLDGANVFFRKEILEEIGGFNPDLGMSGNKMAYGEETALIKNIREKKSGARIYYEPKLLVYHLVPSEKMKLSWNVKSSFIGGIYTAHLLNPNQYLKRFYISPFLLGFVLIVLLLFDLIIGPIFRDRLRYPYIQNYLFEHTFRYITGLGKCWGVIIRNK